MTERITNTTYQILADNDPTITSTVHRNRSINYYPKEETLPPMIEEFLPMRRSHDDFYERFMVQRIQWLKNPEQPIMEDSLPCPNEALRAVPTSIPKKRISNTSCHSGVNSPRALSPAMPVTPVTSHNSQPYPLPTSRIDHLPKSRSQFNSIHQ